VWIGPGVRIGERCRVNPGARVGGRGFGLARGPQGWEEVPQLGSVVVGDDVEIGCNTCIDRGAIGDTVIESGVKLDNLIQIAHNVRIGAHTAIAANVGIAGSVRIGARCMIGGGAGFNGHIEVADDVIVLGYAMVTESLPKKGVYGSGMPIQDAREWRKTVARLHRLGRYDVRLRTIEKQLNIAHKDEPANERDPGAQDH
jgi:UDP-3-O-[3-hydroxymyristoyl] glucosamine N-acyltransferase